MPGSHDCSPALCHSQIDGHIDDYGAEMTVEDDCMRRLFVLSDCFRLCLMTACCKAELGAAAGRQLYSMGRGCTDRTFILSLQEGRHWAI